MAEVTDLLEQVAAPVGGGLGLGGLTGFGLANVWPDPEPDPLDVDKTISELRDDREARWMRKGSGIGGFVALGAVVLEAIKAGIG
jgi:hypothetical protein